MEVREGTNYAVVIKLTADEAANLRTILNLSEYIEHPEYADSALEAAEDTSQELFDALDALGF